jgi:two-component system NtrC family sensor kinase
LSFLSVLSYGIIKKHQGELTVSSELGKGMTFTIRLPIKHVPEEDTNMKSQ